MLECIVVIWSCVSPTTTTKLYTSDQKYICFSLENTVRFLIEVGEDVPEPIKLLQLANNSGFLSREINVSVMANERQNVAA